MVAANPGFAGGRLCPGNLGGPVGVKALLVNPQFWIRCAEIGFLNLLLSGDNAVVIALACRNLPPAQRKLGIFWGVLGAVGLRVVLTAFAAGLLGFPYLKLIGGILLLWIGIKLLLPDEDGDHEIEAAGHLAGAIKTIILADFIMSLDNVLAISGAAHGDMLLVTFGVGLSIPLVIWGSGILARLMGRFWWIVDIGAAVLGWVAGEMILGERVVRGWLGGHPSAVAQRAVQLVLAGMVIVIGRAWARRRGRAVVAVRAGSGR